MKTGLIHRPHPGLPRLATHLRLDDTPVPPAVEWHRRIVLNGDALGNDVHSNCVEAAALRSIQIRRVWAAGDERAPTVDDALALYRRWSAWDGREITDIGTASDTAAARWAAFGIWWDEQWEDVPTIAALDPTNATHMRAAIAWLGPVQLDINLPAAWQGLTSWTQASGAEGAPGSWGAHRVCASGYDAAYLYAVSWGRLVQITWDAIARYALNAETTVSRAWLDVDGRSPAGFDIDALESRAAALAA